MSTDAHLPAPADALAVRELVHRYALSVDERDVDAVAALFTPDARLAVPDPPAHLTPVTEHHGHEGVRTALADLSGLLATVHEVTAHTMSPAGPDTLRGRVAGVAHHYLEHRGELVDVLWRVRYDDEYRRVGDRWLIARRALTVRALETHPVRAVLPAGGSGAG